MKRRSVILLATAVLVASAPFFPRYGAQAVPGAKASSAILYQADWSTGAGGWTLYSGFTVSQGMLTFDGARDSGAFAPFRPTDVPISRLKPRSR